MLVSKLALGAAAVPLALGGIAGSVGQADAHQGRGPGRGNMPTEIREALEHNDYDAWYSAVTAHSQGPFTDHATEDVFEALQEIHDLHEEGDREAAHEAMKELQDELGIDMPPHGMRHGKRLGHFKADLSEEARQALKDAFESEDYNVWLEVATEYLPVDHVERMTEEKFQEMVARRGKMNKFHKFNR